MFHLVKHSIPYMGVITTCCYNCIFGERGLLTLSPITLCLLCSDSVCGATSGHMGSGLYAQSQEISGARGDTHHTEASILDARTQYFSLELLAIFLKMPQVRDCMKCGYRHETPTGKKCVFDPANLSMPQQAKLVKATKTGPVVTDSESECEEVAGMQQVTDCLEGQQQQLTSLGAEFTVMKNSVTDLQEGVKQILDIVKLDPTATSTPKGLGAGVLPPLFGGVRPPSGPLPYDDSEEDCSDSDEEPPKSRRKRKMPFALKRYLPKDVRKASTFHQLVGALSRMQTVHLQRQPTWTPYCGNIQHHVQFLCDRAGMGIYTLEQLLSYDAGVRERANHYDAQAFVYGDEEMINIHLVPKAKQSSSPEGAQGGGSTKKAPKSKSKSKFVADLESPCWRYNNFSCNSGASCAMKHVCYHCWDPSHKQKACPNVKRVAGAKPSA